MPDMKEMQKMLESLIKGGGLGAAAGASDGTPMTD